MITGKTANGVATRMLAGFVALGIGVGLDKVTSRQPVAEENCFQTAPERAMQGIELPAGISIENLALLPDITLRQHLGSAKYAEMVRIRERCREIATDNNFVFALKSLKDDHFFTALALVYVLLGYGLVNISMHKNRTGVSETGFAIFALSNASLTALSLLLGAPEAALTPFSAVVASIITILHSLEIRREAKGAIVTEGGVIAE